MFFLFAQAILNVLHVEAPHIHQMRLDRLVKAPMPAAIGFVPRRIHLRVYATGSMRYVEEIVASASLIMIGHAAFHAAIEQYPGASLTLRRGAKVILKAPGDQP